MFFFAINLTFIINMIIINMIIPLIPDSHFLFNSKFEFK